MAAHPVCAHCERAEEEADVQSCMGCSAPMQAGCGRCACGKPESGRDCCCRRVCRACREADGRPREGGGLMGDARRSPADGQASAQATWQQSEAFREVDDFCKDEDGDGPDCARDESSGRVGGAGGDRGYDAEEQMVDRRTTECADRQPGVNQQASAVAGAQEQFADLAVDASTAVGALPANGSSGGVLGGAGERHEEAPVASQRKRNRLSLEKKVEVYNALIEGKGTLANFAQRYGISLTCVKKIKKEGPQLVRRLEGANIKGSTKTVRKMPWPKLEKGVMQCFEVAREQGSPLTRKAIMSMGLMVRDNLLASDGLKDSERVELEHFSASVSWARSVISRHGLRHTRLHGEADSSDHG
ncbi:unnamed protein product [Ostreobium quekettii]|uniref:Uncharacterized protein n=1 Tax=Ostreobium quekettii TaxID=121088 RepID=A0A8S1J697_9CHLO|nr:unnamed protein product [Ostreobium quekettii]